MKPNGPLEIRQIICPGNVLFCRLYKSSRQIIFKIESAHVSVPSDSTYLNKITKRLSILVQSFCLDLFFYVCTESPYSTKPVSPHTTGPKPHQLKSHPQKPKPTLPNPKRPYMSDNQKKVQKITLGKIAISALFCSTVLLSCGHSLSYTFRLAGFVSYQHSNHLLKFLKLILCVIIINKMLLIEQKKASMIMLATA